MVSRASDNAPCQSAASKLLRPDLKVHGWLRLRITISACRYDQEEGGGVDETHDHFVGDNTLFEKRAAEMQKKMTRRDGSMMTLAQSKRASELQRDITAWEDNLLLRSGVASLREVTLRNTCHRLPVSIAVCHACKR